MESRWYWLMAVAIGMIFVFGCQGDMETKVKSDYVPNIPEFLPRMGYAVQVGAFSFLDNAVRLTEALQQKGLDAYYFKHDSGLYKVRFGDFSSEELALAKAEDLRSTNVIEDFYIVGPEDYPWGRDNRQIDTDHLRRGIVQAAESFIGVPYRFGGASPEEGFDCSGLAMAVYRLNGFALPRTSRQQWSAGRPVNDADLDQADLVFFATSRRGEISHVGIYMGKGQFIHAPKSGKEIRIDSISNHYFKHRYMGARTYL